MRELSLTRSQMAAYLDHQAVYERRKSKKSSLKVQLLAALVLLLALSMRVWIKVKSTDLGYELGKERSQMVELDMAKRELELQLSVILRPDSLGQLAAAKLGLRPLDSSQAFKIEME